MSKEGDSCINERCNTPRVSNTWIVGMSQMETCAKRLCQTPVPCANWYLILDSGMSNRSALGGGASHMFSCATLLSGVGHSLHIGMVLEKLLADFRCALLDVPEFRLHAVCTCIRWSQLRCSIVAKR
jgi:hypothetical protein